MGILFLRNSLFRTTRNECCPEFCPPPSPVKEGERQSHPPTLLLTFFHLRSLLNTQARTCFGKKNWQLTRGGEQESSSSRRRSPASSPTIHYLCTKCVNAQGNFCLLRRASGLDSRKSERADSAPGAFCHSALPQHTRRWDRLKALSVFRTLLFQ